MTTWRGRHYSFKEQTEFTMINKILDTFPSNIKDSLLIATVLLPFTLKELFCKNVMFSPMKTLRGRHYSLKQQSQFTMLNKMLHPLPLTVMIFLEELQWFSIHLKGVFGTTVMFLTHENAER
jgi:hypothetical protein